MSDIEVPNTAVEELLGSIKMLSPAYLLSVERWPFHSEPPDHYDRLRLCSTCQSHSQAGLCHCTLRMISDRSEPTLRTPPLLFGRRPPQSNYPPYNVLMPDNGYQLDIKKNKRGISLDSTKADAFASMSPPMLNMFFLTPM